MMKFLHPSLMIRTAVALALVGLLPLLLAAWRLSGLNRDALRSQVLQTHVLAASATAQRLADFLALRRTLAEMLASRVAAGDSAAISELLYGMLEARPNLDVAEVRNDEGALVLRARRVAADDAVEALMEMPLTGETGAALLPADGTADDRRWVRLDTPLPEIGGELRLLWRDAALQRIFDVYPLAAEARLSLVDRRGRWLAGSPLGAGEAPPAVLDQIRSGVLSGAQVRAEPGGEETLAAFDAVEGASWVVLSRQPAAVAEAVARSMRREALGAVAVALALITLLAAAAWVSVVRPLRALTRVQQRLAGLRGTPAGGSEIDQLKASFAALERSLHEREEVERVFLGRYLVVGVLGEGAMGTVFRGWDPRLQRPVALKTVHLERLAEDGRRDGRAAGSRTEQAARLLGEAVTVAQFNHPNIVSIYDVEDAGEAAFIAMELVEGPTLEHHLRTARVLPPGQAAYIGAAIARALAEAHSRDIVHHDVKPANVLLSRDGAVKVTDFGVSRLLTHLSGDGNVYGTPGYLPPETLQLEGYDRRGDLFGLGAVLYHGLTGKRPFDGKDSREIILRTLRGVVRPPRDLAAGIPEELSRLVMELLARDPARRPASAADVARRLERLAESLPSGGRPRFDEDPLRASTPTPGGAAPTTSRWVRLADLEPPAARRRGSEPTSE